jgi:hypothetical protein
LKRFQQNLTQSLPLSVSNQFFNTLRFDGIALFEDTNIKSKCDFDTFINNTLPNLQTEYNFGATTRKTFRELYDRSSVGDQKTLSFVVGTDPPSCKMCGHTDKSHSINPKEIPQLCVMVCISPSPVGGKNFVLLCFCR